MKAVPHPADVLFREGERVAHLPVCDHYAGIEPRMRKSLALQAELGPVFDVTLDAEDGAAAGGHIAQAHLIAELVNSPLNAHGRVGVRVLPPDHPAFLPMLEVLLPRVGARLAYVMVPKPRHAQGLNQAVEVIDGLLQQAGLPPQLPIHTLIETQGGLHDVWAMAAHPRVQSLSFGLMDFVSSHHGAIPRSAMSAAGQFEHPLVLRAKLEIAAACHAHGKVPSHCVVTEFSDRRALEIAAEKARNALGYTRMWSIHPDQIRIIIEAFAPTAAEVEEAVEVILAAQAADWAPIRHRHLGRDQLHDRASYRFFWHVLERAHRTSFAGGPQLPPEVQKAYFAP
jgi:citrate lyase subunit beta/citryl-CoA lyase